MVKLSEALEIYSQEMLKSKVYKKYGVVPDLNVHGGAHSWCKFTYRLTTMRPRYYIYLNDEIIGEELIRKGVKKNVLYKSCKVPYRHDNLISNDILKIKQFYEKHDVAFYFINNFNPKAREGVFMKEIILENLYLFPICSDVTKLICSYL